MENKYFWEKKISSFSKLIRRKAFDEFNFPIKIKECFEDPFRLILIETCKHSYFLQCFISKLYELPNYEELVKREKIFCVELKHPTEFTSRKDPLK